MTSIAIIGGGNMGEALIKGLHKTHRVVVCEADVARVQYLKKKYRLTVGPIAEAAENSDIIVFAVKPQDMPSVLTQIKVSPRKLYISIAAGLTTKFFETSLSGKPKVIRTMPNMPALIGEGITGICAGKYAKPADLKLAQSILGAIGQTVIVKESMIDAVTAVSGSGPAYVFLFVEQWINAALQLGFKPAEAKQLVYQTLIGSAHLLCTSEFDAGTLRQKVTSKGGTTQAALDIFSRRRFDQIMKDVLAAARARAKELAK